MIDPVEFGKQIAQIVKEATAPLLKRIEQLENVKPDTVAIDVDQIAKAAAELIPAPKDGKDGQDALPVDVEAIAASFERRFSDLQLSWERQARDTFEKALDRMPIPQDGKDGKDALPIEDIEIKQDGRHVTIKLGDVERTIKLDTVIDKGVWREAEYEKGDAVTCGGSLWIAQEDLPEGAPGATKDWRLAVKKGRDGRDLRDSASQHDKSKSISL